MNLEEVLAELEKAASPSTKKVLMKHGAKEPFYGVKVADLKLIQKMTKNNQSLALDLYKTGNSDAMYLAGLMADGKLMSKDELQSWVEAAYWSMLSEYTVPWVASESNFGMELASEWIVNPDENIAAAGWSTWSCVVSFLPDDKLPIAQLRMLLNRVKNEIHTSQNRVKYCMNNFVIALGSYVSELSDEALEAASALGTVYVDMGGTACKVPDAHEYISKSKSKGSLLKKKKTVKC